MGDADVGYRGRPRNEKACVDCGGSFLPNSGAQKRCTPCRVKQKPKRSSKPKAKSEPKRDRYSIKGTKGDPNVQQAPKAKKKRMRRRKADEITARVGAKMDSRLERIDQESFERFRGA